MDLQECRAEIDRIDAQIARLFSERMDVVTQVGTYKQTHGLPIRDEVREEEKLREIERLLPDGLAESGRALFEQIFAISRAWMEQHTPATVPARDNIILIGMSGCGKSTLTRALAQRLGRDDFDSDELICAMAGTSLSDIVAQRGEDAFRKMETEALAALCERGGRVIATGGGCVTREENYAILHGGGTVIWVKRDMEALLDSPRRFVQKRGVRKLYEEREPLYERFADITVENNGPVEEAVDAILDVLREKRGETI